MTFNNFMGPGSPIKREAESCFCFAADAREVYRANYATWNANERIAESFVQGGKKNLFVTVISDLMEIHKEPVKKVKLVFMNFKVKKNCFSWIVF